MNPSGFVFETLTVYKAKNILFFGAPNPEYSWFPGYAWTSGSCRNCHHQMGWKFTVTKEKEGEEGKRGLANIFRLGVCCVRVVSFLSISIVVVILSILKAV